MSARRALIAVADDLTGACEIAGRAHEAGLRARVALGREPAGTEEADLLVLDTETRLSPPTAAARYLARLGTVLKPGDRPLFKKIDSVLRGPVAAEATALAFAAHYRRILLVPANPAAGRMVRDGEYLVDGRPLSTTAFRNDPHHPIRSSRVIELVGAADGFLTRSSVPGEPLPPGSLTIGDATSPQDLDRWAEAIPSDTLTGGSAAFFAAWLRPQLPASARPPYGGLELPAGPTLVLSGTTAPVQRDLIRSTPAIAWGTIDEIEHRAARPWMVRVEALLRAGRNAVAAVDGPVVPAPLRTARVRAALAAIALHAARHHLFRHLVIEGGATAAAVLRALNWTTLEAVREWAAGVVTLRPLDAPECRVTVKPGSYPWPGSFTRRYLTN